MRKIIFIFLVLFVLAYFFRGDINDMLIGRVVLNEKEETLLREYGDFNIYFCQVDDCETQLLQQIAESETIDCAFFDFDLLTVMEALKQGDHRIVLDGKNRKGVFLPYVRVDDRDAYMHNKFCIFDNRIVMTGSMNPTINDARKNDNNLIFIESKILADNYNEEFLELWNGEFGKGNYVKNSRFLFNGYLVENYFCPEDDCEDHVLNLLNGAQKNIHFMTYSFTSDVLGKELIQNYHYGIDVKGVFDHTQAGSDYSEFHRLNDLGMNVRRDKNKGFMHHKVFIVDDAVVLGSYNPTSSGNTKNDENIIIFHDPHITSEFEQEFKRIYEISL